MDCGKAARGDKIVASGDERRPSERTEQVTGQLGHGVPIGAPGGKHLAPLVVAVTRPRPRGKAAERDAVQFGGARAGPRDQGGEGPVRWALGIAGQKLPEKRGKRGG
ncbi:MAG TPA: hypothetical protein VIM50_01700, partial [Candidatus Limnocylindria bacterium]